MTDLDRNVGRHSRLEFKVRISDPDDRVIGHDILDDERLIVDVVDLSMKRTFGISVHRELGLLAHPDLSDIGLVHAGINLHLGQVLCDREKGRGLKRGRHGLAHIHVTGDDDPVHRRPDRGVTEIGLGETEGCLILHDLSLGGLQSGNGEVISGLRGILVTLGNQIF